MPSLEQSQSAFVAALREPRQDPPSFIAEPTPRSSLRRFNVYRNNVYAGLIGVLGARYPAVQRLVGDEFFKAMARVFIDGHPPRSPVLIEYGSGLAEFLRTFEPAADERYLADVATLEWRMHQARHAADAIPLHASHLIQLDEGSAARLTIRLAPAVSLIVSEYPVFSLWRANATDEASSGHQTFSGAECVLVTRPDLIAEAVRIPQSSAMLIAALLDRKPLAAAIGSVLAVDPHFPLHRTLALLIAQKAIAGVASQDETFEETPS